MKLTKADWAATVGRAQNQQAAPPLNSGFASSKMIQTADATGPFSTMPAVAVVPVPLSVAKSLRKRPRDNSWNSLEEALAADE